MNKKPNVLFILSDQHNAKCLGHQGHPDVKTPYLDRLAVEGVRCQNAIVQAPICTPSRMCYHSGQYAHNHGFYGLDGPNPGGLPTIFGHFRQAGYRTASIGKIHCPENWIEDDCDVFHETSTNGSTGGRSPAYTAYLRKRNVEHLEDHEKFHELGPGKGQSLDGRPSKISYDESREGWATQTATDFMHQCRDDNSPFFTYVSFSKPHQNYAPAAEFWDLYDESKLNLPPNAEHDGADQAPHLLKLKKVYQEKVWQDFEPKTFEAGRLRKLHGYLGNISHVDHAVGQLLDALQQMGLEENTIVVYGSDHGDYACEFGLMEKAPGICHDAITRVPFIWRWPGKFKAGHVAEGVVETIDNVRTLCSLAGLPALATADGRDISAQLFGETGDPDRLGVTELAWSKSLRKGKYRMVFYPREAFSDQYPDGFGELYDLEADPWEMENLFFNSAYEDVVRAMNMDLLDWTVTTTRPRTTLGVDARRGRTPPANGQAQTRANCWHYPDGKISSEAIREAWEQGRKNYI